MRIRIQLFTLMWIQIQLFTSMRTRILLFIKVIGIYEHLLSGLDSMASEL
jgi:hypothetical protein